MKAQTNGFFNNIFKFREVKFSGKVTNFFKAELSGIAVFSNTQTKTINFNSVIFQNYGQFKETKIENAGRETLRIIKN